jgi:hypothetical protein
MTDPNVQPDPWAAIAAELHRIADDCEKLIGHAAPALVAFDIQPFAEVIHPPVPGQRGEIIQAVDDVAQALLGKSAETQALSDGKSFHHTISGRRGRISVGIYQAVADPAEVEQLRAGRTGRAAEPAPEPLVSCARCGQPLTDDNCPDECPCAIDVAAVQCSPECLAQHANRDGWHLGDCPVFLAGKGDADADPTGLDYSREADDPTPVSGARVAMHTGAVADCGLVEEAPL